jgi:ribonuclease Y
MDQFILLIIISVVIFILGSVLGYYARQSVAKKQSESLEAEIEKRILKAKGEAEAILSKSRKEAETILITARERFQQTLKKTNKEIETRHNEIFKAEGVLLKRENILNQKLSEFEKKEKNFQEEIEKIRKIKVSLENLKDEAFKKLEEIAEFSKTEAKEELFKKIEQEYQQEILERIRRLEKQGSEKFEVRAREILATVIQKCAFNQAQEITTTSLNLPSEDIKGRIIGKEGRNIKALERLTGTEIVVDETPETILISGFDPTRRQIAKIALEKLIKDGRIQPVKIEEQVKKAEEEILAQIKEAGETAAYELGIVGLDPKLIQLLGRLKFRFSYGQNVLSHSIEVAYLAGMLAAEIGADVRVSKKAGLLHDIGKAVDHQIEGSHIDIGIKILEKFDKDEAVIKAMKSHHEDYAYESLEAVLIQTADQISGARPGARKDTLENYLKRLKELENIALSFSGIEKAWALQAGREIRVFVKPEEIDDLSAKKLAKEIANKIHQELRYPGEIKVNVIRETRVVEYAR